MFFTACSTDSSNSKPAGAHLSTAGVIQIAKQAAERDGYNLREFRKPSADYEPLVGRRGLRGMGWFVYFRGKDESKVGNFFSVSVDDETGESILIGGR